MPKIHGGNEKRTSIESLGNGKGLEKHSLITVYFYQKKSSTLVGYLQVHYTIFLFFNQQFYLKKTEVMVNHTNLSFHLITQKL